VNDTNKQKVEKREIHPEKKKNLFLQKKYNHVD
jgi:hypothetical protein